MMYFRCKTQLLQQNCFWRFLAVGFLLAFPVLAFAAPGALDPTFGNGGVVYTAFGQSSFAYGVAIQTDGKIVVVGGEYVVNTGTERTVLIRYNSNGTLDASFGNGGKVVASFGFSNFAADIAIQADGRIVIAGATGSPNSDFFAARFETTGALDTSFGTSGIVTVNMGSDDSANAVAIQTDGKIVISGSSSANTFAVARINPNGLLDTSFDGDGRAFTNFGAGFATAMALQQDGKIIVVGSNGNSTMNPATDFVLVRYNADGSLDSTLDGDGIVNTPVGSLGDFAFSVAVQPDGKIIAVGMTFIIDGGMSDFAIVRYNSNGSLDTSFDGDGIAVTGFGLNDLARSVAIQSNGRIVVAGSRGGDGNEYYEAVLARYNPNGSLDTSFGTGGRVIAYVGLDDSFQSVAIQPDGKIVAAGTSYNQVGSDYIYQVTAARFIGDTVVVNRKLFDFDGDGRSDISVFRQSDRTWYLNRSTQEFSATQFGLSTDKITPADYDGDGKTDIAVFRNGFWYWLNSSNNQFNAIHFGLAGDIPVPADFTGDGRTELAVYRFGIWYWLNLVNNQTNSTQFGLSTDKPVIGDYDGDARADYAVYREGTWYLQRSTEGFAAIQFGLSTDRLVPADYDGDGKTDLAVYRNGTWYLLLSNQGFTAFQLGLVNDVPAPADYDGDGRADAAVFRNGTWYLRQSTNGFATVAFGSANDQPVPAAYLP